MENKKQEMIQKVLKLLELGNDDKNSNSNEAESAKRMAAKLMADYSLEFADLKANINKSENFVKIDVDGAEGVRVNWEFNLAGCIAKVFDCKIVGRTEWVKNIWGFSFLGTKGDLDVAIFFFQYLRRTVGKMSESKYYSNKNSANIYAFGMTMTLKDRLDDLFARREEFIPSDCKELMVVKGKELDSFMKEQYPNLKMTSISIGKDSAAYSRGRDDGHRVNLSRPIGNGNSKSAAQLGA